MQEYSKADESPEKAVYKTAPKREGGYIPVPEAPGLGVELDDDLISSRPPVQRDLTIPLREDGSVAYSV